MVRAAKTPQSGRRRASGCRVGFRTVLPEHAHDSDWRPFKARCWKVDRPITLAVLGVRLLAATTLVAREAGALRELLAAVAASHARVHAQVVRQAAALREAAPALCAREGPLPGMDASVRPMRGSKGNAS